MKKRRIENEKDAIDYLVANGIDKENAGEITSEIINQRGQMMKKSFSNAVSDLLKSLTGCNPKDNDEDIRKGNEDGASADDENLDDGNDGIDLDDDDEDKDDEDGGKNDDEDMVDGGEVLKALDVTISTLAKSQKATEKRLNDLGEAIVGLAEMVSVIGNQKIPPRTVLNKSMIADGNNAGKQNLSARPTEDDLYRVQCVLAKAVKEGRLDMVKSSMISSDMQKCMYTGKPMRKDYYEFLQKELAKEAN